MSTQQLQQPVQSLTIKNAELQQLQQIVDNIPTKYGRILDAFFLGVQKRRKEEAEAGAKLAEAKKKEVKSEPASETATGINNSEEKK